MKRLTNVVSVIFVIFVVLSYRGHLMEPLSSQQMERKKFLYKNAIKRVTFRSTQWKWYENLVVVFGCHFRLQWNEIENCAMQFFFRLLLTRYHCFHIKNWIFVRTLNVLSLWEGYKLKWGVQRILLYFFFTFIVSCWNCCFVNVYTIVKMVLIQLLGNHNFVIALNWTISV